MQRKLINVMGGGIFAIMLLVSNVNAENVLSINTEISQQQREVTGTVVDDSGEPLPGVNVVVKGTTTGIQTDMDGNFEISNVPGGSNAILVFSYMGFSSQEVKVGDQTKFYIQLKEDLMALDEVVVVGYGTSRKKDLSGAIQNVKYSDSPITLLPNPNALSALSSKVAGLHYSPTNSASGDNTSTMNLRGRNSIPQSTSSSDQSTNSPLLVVDGSIFHGSINEIQTTDIQSIDVMKDASSAAIYGSRAANGVIIITTKSGTSEKPTVNLNASIKFNTWGRKPNLQTDKQTFLERRHQARIAAGSAEAGSAADPAADLSEREYEVWQAGGWVDWLDEITQSGPSQNYSVNISGRSNITSYYLSAGYDREKGLLKGDDYERYTFLAKIDTQIKSWLKVGIKGNYLGAKRWGSTPSMQAATWMSPLSYKNVRFDGYTDWVEEYPTGVDGQINPLWGRENYSYLWTDDKTINYNINGVGYIQIDFPFLKGLQYKFTLYGQRNTSTRDLFNNPQLWLDTRILDNLQDPLMNAGSSTGLTDDSHSSTWNADNVLTYNNDFGKHHVDAMVGYTREAYNYERIRTDFSGFDIPSSTTLGVYATDLSNADNLTVARQRTSSSSIAYLARANYNYANKYYATYNFRRDGFSAFANGHKWGNFHGVSGAWVLSSEDFMEDVAALEYLKLRLSWGQNGSRGISAYATIATMNKTYAWFGESSYYAMYVSQLQNNDLTWATTSKWNIGIDFGLIKNRLNGTIDIYKSKTTDMLLNRSIPYVNGFEAMDANAGEVSNKGLEITLNSVNIEGDGNKSLRWESNLAFDLNRNKIVKLFDDMNSDDVQNVSNYGYDNYYALLPGHSITSAWDYKVLGIFQSQEEIDNYKSADGTVIQSDAKPGDLKIEDYDGNGTIDVNDKHWIGDMDPLFTVNFGNTFSYKNFQLYFSFRWMQGNSEHFLGYDPNAFSIGSSNNQLDIEPWTEENHSNKYPRYGYGNPYGYNYWNQRTFLKLKDLSLSYNIGNKILKKTGINNIRLYVAATDLFTITGWSGLDPENGGTIAAGMSSTRYGMTPTYRTITIGTNITF